MLLDDTGQAPASMCQSLILIVREKNIVQLLIYIYAVPPADWMELVYTLQK